MSCASCAIRRDVAVSLAGLPFGEETQVGNLLRIHYDDRRSRQFFRSDARALTLRYEDLVAVPERELRRVCDHIGESFETAMLDHTRSAVEVAPPHEWWKASIHDGLDRSRSGRWRTRMDDDVQRFASLHLARYLNEHGYDGARRAGSRLALLPFDDVVAPHDERFLLDLAARDVALIRPTPRHAAHLRRHKHIVFFGVRGQLDPLRNGGRVERVRNTTRLAALLLLRRLQGRPVLWVRRPSLREPRPTDACEIAIAAQLRLFARSVEPEAVAAAVASR